MVFIGLVRLCIQYFHAFGFLGILVVQQFCYDGKGSYREVACFHGSRQGGRLRAEISAEGATFPATVPELAFVPAFDGSGEVGHPAYDYMTAVIVMLFDPGGNIFLYTVQFHRRQELPVGQVRQAFSGTADACKFLYIIIPGGQVAVAYRPIHPMSVFRIGFQDRIAEAVTLPASEDGAAAHLVTAPPGKGLYLCVGTIVFIGPVIYDRFICG